MHDGKGFAAGAIVSGSLEFTVDFSQTRGYESVLSNMVPGYWDKLHNISSILFEAFKNTVGLNLPHKVAFA